MMTKVWQCNSVDYHIMVRQVNRCTLCGSSVKEKILERDNKSSQLSELIEFGFDYELAQEILKRNEPF